MAQPRQTAAATSVESEECFPINQDGLASATPARVAEDQGHRAANERWARHRSDEHGAIRLDADGHDGAKVAVSADARRRTQAGSGSLNEPCAAPDAAPVVGVTHNRVTEIPIRGLRAAEKVGLAIRYIARREVSECSVVECLEVHAGGSREADAAAAGCVDFAWFDVEGLADA